MGFLLNTYESGKKRGLHTVRPRQRDLYRLPCPTKGSFITPNYIPSDLAQIITYPAEKLAEEVG